tara:strand:- start:4434 stop:5405 length:972 start_codon:yes stop_codon:yes gene_type:complete
MYIKRTILYFISVYTLFFILHSCDDQDYISNRPIRNSAEQNETTYQINNDAIIKQDDLNDYAIVENDLDQSICTNNQISGQSIEIILDLTEFNPNNIYSVYNYIDTIASIFEICKDPRGMFTTTYRRITKRIIDAIENKEISDQTWGHSIVIDFASRYLQNLRLHLQNEQPSYAWQQYYYLANNINVSRTRAVVIGMVAHLTLDLPHSLVNINTTENQKDDYFTLGELMIEITPLFIEDLKRFYDTDTEDILNGFFLGQWVDNVFGNDTMITLSYQTIRTKSWNVRWYLQKSWGRWVAQNEIYTAFWAIDGVLASLDQANIIN